MPLVPVIVSGKLPVGVVLAVVTVIVEEPEVVTDGGVKLAVAPAGNPLALKVTVPVNPPVGVTVTVYVVLLPWSTGCDAGVAEIEKSGLPHVLNLKLAIRVLQLNDPVAFKYSVVYHMVQSSTGSTLRAL